MFSLGRLGARYTKGNGLLDAEDLNGDDLLDGEGKNENVFRFIVTLEWPTTFRSGRHHRHRYGASRMEALSDSHWAARRDIIRRRCGWFSAFG